MKRGDVFAAVAAQRRYMADLVDALSDEQLATPSLCAGWDVKTVAAHVISTIDDGLPTFLRLAARRRSLDRAIDELARQRAGASAFEIASVLRQYADRPVDPPLFGPLDPLADVLVHLGDISIPLDIDYQPDPELVKLALDFLTGPWPFGFVPFRLLRGLSLYARRRSPVGRRPRNSRTGGRVDDDDHGSKRLSARIGRPGRGGTQKQAVSLTFAYRHSRPRKPSSTSSW
jgi:uncharacterized protein (TIGR03083 family)